jgi:hypothetical protein
MFLHVYVDQMNENKCKVQSPKTTAPSTRHVEHINENKCVPCMLAAIVAHTAILFPRKFILNFLSQVILSGSKLRIHLLWNKLRINLNKANLFAYSHRLRIFSAAHENSEHLSA